MTKKRRQKNPQLKPNKTVYLPHQSTTPKETWNPFCNGQLLLGMRPVLECG